LLRQTFPSAELRTRVGPVQHPDEVSRDDLLIGKPSSDRPAIPVNPAEVESSRDLGDKHLGALALQIGVLNSPTQAAGDRLEVIGCDQAGRVGHVQLYRSHR
jgi:hypothetical protein